jgi:hypothetical protein
MPLDLQAAELELLFLRGTLPDDIDVPREPLRVSARPELMRPVGEPRELSVVDAIEYLVAQPKPLRCMARLWQGKLSIIVGAPTAEQLQFHEWSLAIPSAKSWQKVESSMHDPVLVKSKKERLTVPFEAFDSWQRDYVRSGSTMIGGPQPAKDSGPTEPRWELWVGKTGPIGESYSLHEDESVLCDRCRQQLAIAVFRDRTQTPLTMELLCEDCLRANVGREFAREVFRMDNRLSDKESHQLLDNMFKSMREDAWPTQGDEPEK